ncbi:MAG TPA: M50 family metallopeptidase [Gaiellaceae bacterium]
MSIEIAIAGLAVLILIHEAGHFFAARAVGMRPRKFYLGFPPAVLKTTRGGVEYGIGAIPLGGYVKIPGMHRAAPGDLRGSLKPEDQQALADELDALDAALEQEDEDAARALLPAFEPRLSKNRMFQELEGSLASDAYWRQPAWKRVVVIAAGPLVNVACAVVLFIAVFMVGSQVATRTIAIVQKGKPAQLAGLRSGDVVLAIAGKAVTADSLAPSIKATAGHRFSMTVRRAGKPLRIGPLKAVEDQGAYRIGIGLKGRSGPGDSLLSATGKSFRLVGDVTAGTFTGIAGLVRGKGTHDVSSSVGIVKVTAQAYRASLQDFFFFIGYISLALALLNLLPILPLDGGHIVMSILERVRGRAFSQLAYLRYSAVGLTFFMFMLYLGLRNDLFSGGS